MNHGVITSRWVIVRGVSGWGAENRWMMIATVRKTRPDTRLPQSRAGGQGPYFRSVEHLGSSSMAKKTKTAIKRRTNRLTDGRMDGQRD